MVSVTATVTKESCDLPMKVLRLFYATNHDQLGKDHWDEDGHGRIFSDDGIENPQFGRVTIEADESKMTQHWGTDRGPKFQDWWNVVMISRTTPMPLSSCASMGLRMIIRSKIADPSVGRNINGNCGFRKKQRLS